jgi:glycerophosphoryl diester phosphodiesterase
VIVLHDRTLGRVTGGRETRDVETMTARELQRVDVGGGESPPLLTDVLMLARERGARVNVELKRDVSRPLTLIEGVANCVHATRGPEELLVFSSFHPGLVVALALGLPRFARAWLVHRGQRILKRAPFFRALGADGVHPEHALVTSEALSRWKHRPAIVNAWTVNAASEARRVADLGVDGIVSDHPGAILDAFSAAPARAR